MSSTNWSRPFEELVVGERFATENRIVGERDILMFAALTGDHHPAHVDPGWAASGPFGEQIAHGMLVMSLAVGMVPFDPSRVIALRKVSDVVFKRPVRLGEMIRVEGTLEEVREVGEEAGITLWSWAVVGPDGRAACRARLEVLWKRSDPDAEYDPFAPDHHGFLPIPL
jgi:acyl dehydratase